MRDIRVLVADDEEPARRRLEELVLHSAGATLVGSCEGGQQAIDALQRAPADLIFLDVRMPEVTGFDVLKAIGPDRMPMVVFVTAYDEYALKAFEHAAIDYLLKPFDDDRFSAALGRARERFALQSTSQLRSQLVELLHFDEASMTTSGAQLAPCSSYAHRIAVRDHDIVRLIDVATVEYIHAQGPYVELHVGKERILHRERMHILEARLDPAEFCRIHRSTIVHLRSVTALELDKAGDHHVQTCGGASLKVSRTRMATFQARLSLL